MGVNMLRDEFVIELCDEYITIYGDMYAKEQSDEKRKVLSYFINTLTEIRDARLARQGEVKKDTYEIAKEIFL